MIIRTILISAILAIAGWFLINGSSTRVKAAQKLWVIVLAVFGIASVLIPEATSQLAHLLGVGRGADLLTYLLAVSFLGFTLAQYMNNKKQQQAINSLARKLAILESVERSTHKNNYEN